MHAAELCHSDLKPSSILVEVGNFSVSASLQNLEVSQILTHKIFPGRRFHRTHIQYDYLHYAAPETISRFRQKKVNLGSVEEFLQGDIFSIGMLTFELLHQQAPWSLGCNATATTTVTTTSTSTSTSLKQQQPAELTQLVEQELEYATTQSD
jgi:serine/threonine protein kinase